LKEIGKDYEDDEDSEDENFQSSLDTSLLPSDDVDIVESGRFEKKLIFEFYIFIVFNLENRYHGHIMGKLNLRKSV
jgi:hypothetical protein